MASATFPATARDEPHGRFTSRQIGKPLTAKKFHLYRDCSMLLADREIMEVVNVDDRLVDLLCMSVCSPCQNRSEEVSFRDLVADTILAFGDEAESEQQLADDLAAKIEAAIEDAGYKVRRVRRGGPTRSP